MHGIRVIFLSFYDTLVRRAICVTFLENLALHKMKIFIKTGQFCFIVIKVGVFDIFTHSHVYDIDIYLTPKS